MDAPLSGQLVHLADKGNLILVVRDAREKGTDKRPTITLEEDDVEAMDFILSNIHCKGSRINDDFTALAIVDIAVQSDKYDCNDALTSWIRLWCDPDRFPVSNASQVRDMGYGLLAAYLFRSPKLVAMSGKYVRKLPSDFAISWKSYKHMSRLPSIVRDTLTREITTAQSKIRLQVLSTLTELLGHDDWWPSGNPDAEGTPPRSCAAQYIEALARLNIWPSLLPFETHSAEDLTCIIHTLPPFLNNEDILRDALHNLYYDAYAIKDGMEGVSLALALGADSEGGDNGSDESAESDSGQSSSTSHW
ncbi:hypothetical protein C8A01DRAFT_38707 [Parachaetomium inaequale]|uniref:Uncharacterized protein n=1 Tax=Parachaetomium inaequale TaxID=2588326 RepID=A0AAN6PF25_9PEZI|nr:hypothetical protein C8A01DRAFT_38707 [Parachaetomium inaequale]